MNKKKGFTLVELIAVILILSVIGVMTMPTVLKKYKESRVKALVIQESKLVESASILITDYCDKPIDENHYLSCNKYYREYSGTSVYNSKKVYTNYICTKDLKELRYYSEDLEYSGKKCYGAVIYKLDENTKAVVDSYSYVKCGSKYTSEKMTNFDEDIYRLCVSDEVDNNQVDEPEVEEPEVETECSHYDAVQIADGEPGKCFCPKCGKTDVTCPNAE